MHDAMRDIVGSATRQMNRTTGTNERADMEEKQGYRHVWTLVRSCTSQLLFGRKSVESKVYEVQNVSVCQG